MIPKPLSEAEETLAMHLTAHKISFKREQCLIPDRKFRTDFLVKDLAIEVDGGIWKGGRHGTGKGITADCEKLNGLTLGGYRSLRFTSAMVLDGTAINTILEALK
jgi:very-short-patch-repair endonuclease